VIKTRRALISVSDKTGLIELAQQLHQFGAELLSTGGTARHLRDAGIPVKEVSEHTGSPEILDGRVKTLHPKIHGGLLALREKQEHMQQLRQHGIQEIDMVVVNLYPFLETARRQSSTFEEVVEQIDIGGPSMVRSAAKNHGSVAVVTDPADYGWLMDELNATGGYLSAASRFRLAQKAFALTASYDAAIASWLAEREWSDQGVRKTSAGLPLLDVLPLQRTHELRYGENPHQRGALYARLGSQRSGVAGAEVLHGKELSYNNLLDADAAWNLVLEFDRPASAVIKHTNPSGVAQSDMLYEAYVLARDCDPVSAYGSVVALNRKVDEQTASEINTTFIEVVLAPDFSPEALGILKQKRNLRLLRVGPDRDASPSYRHIGGGFLVQDQDRIQLRPENLKVVTKRAPSHEEMEALLFGWRVVKHVKSNAIVFSNASRTLGIGAGQMSRIDSVKWGAQRATLPLKGCALASDAFFPFPDGLVTAVEYGVRAVIQPGGSVRDAEVIAAADERDVAMLFTGMRHFKH
jgi:phosphoribosylaminoimidazolecarboxamide formyltransferase / IMP cyclohydrolase